MSQDVTKPEDEETQDTQTQDTETQGTETKETETKTFTQDEVAKLLSEERKKLKADLEATKTALEEANGGRSELEKERDQLASAKGEAEKDRIKLTVALDKGLSLDLVNRLQGETEEELAADADALLAIVKPAAPARPAGSADGGTRQPTKPKDEHAAAIARLFGRA